MSILESSILNLSDQLIDLTNQNENENHPLKNEPKSLYLQVSQSLLNKKQHSSKNLDKNLFTFKPKLNAKTNLIAQNFLNFYERQSLHTQKQLEQVI